MRRVVELRGPPTIGVSYLVPTLRAMPIVPTIHTDDGLDRPHVHIDMRFVKRIGHGVWHAERSNGDLVIIRSSDCLPHEVGPRARQATVLECVGDEKFFEIGFVCQQSHKWPAGITFSDATSIATKPVCRNGRLYCPHRGADVTTLRPSKAGFVRCPLHGQLLDMRADQTDRPLTRLTHRLRLLITNSN